MGPKADEKDVVTKRTEIIVALADKAPVAARGYIVKAAPHIAKAVTLGEKAIPYIKAGYEKCQAFYKVIEPYHPEDLLPMFAGIVMCFFGGVCACRARSPFASRRDRLG